MFLDANIFINAALSGGKDGMRCRSLMDKIAKGEQHASTSLLALDEVLFTLIELRGREFAAKRYEMAITMPNLELLPVDKRAAHFLMEFFSQGLEPRDALHAATMKANRVETICSFDHAFDKVKGIKRQEPV